MHEQSTPNGAVEVSDSRDRAHELDALLRQHAPTVELWLVALAEFHRDRLWSVMGYPTWAAWAQERIGKGHTAVYRWLSKGYDLLPSPPASAIVHPEGTIPSPSPQRAETKNRPSRGRPFGAPDKAPRQPTTSTFLADGDGVPAVVDEPLTVEYERFAFHGERLAELRALARNKKRSTQDYLDWLIHTAHQNFVAQPQRPPAETYVCRGCHQRMPYRAPKCPFCGKVDPLKT